MMKLTNYQKSYLNEFMWNVHHEERDDDVIGSGENTCWLEIDESNGELFHAAKMLLKYEDVECSKIKVLVVASHVE
tara:strand:- start:246 stop:473 length:228 start_codon:yes stop_codon:yes gene_type:complete